MPKFPKPKVISKAKTETTAPSEGSTEAAKPKWGPVSAILVSGIAFFSSQFIAALLMGVYAGIRGFDPHIVSTWLTDNTYGQFLFILLAECILIGIVALFLHSRRANPRDIGLVKPRWRDPLYMVVAFVVYFATYLVAVTAVKQLVPSLNLDQRQEIGFESAAGQQLVWVFISLVVLPPIAEEILFRGFLYGGLRTKFKFIPAAIFTSILFAIAHLQFGSGAPLLWVAAIDTFVLSMVLVYLREKTGSLVPCIGLHMLKNCLAFLMLFVFAAR